MEENSKIIRNIDSVTRFRQLLFAQYTVPPAAAALFYLVAFISTTAKISIPVLPVLIILFFSPPVLFTPYFVYVLIREKRFLWLTIFVIMLIPGIVSIFFWHKYFMIVWMLLVILPYYIFCFIIKFSVDEWIREYNWEQQLIGQRKESEEKKKEGLL